MKKIVCCLIFFSFYSLVFAIEFKEERFLEALNHSIIKKGNIKFENSGVLLQYENDSNSFSFQNNQLFKLPENVLIDNQASIIYFTLLQAIFNDDLETLNYYFEISNKESLHILTPKAMIANYIETIEYTKINNQLKQLIIYLKNSDRIMIEPLY